MTQKKDVIMSKIRLDTLEKNQLDTRAMNAVKGGKTCGCACAYENTGGSSSSQNEDANFDNALWSPEIIDCKPAWWYNESDGCWYPKSIRLANIDLDS